MMPAMKSLQPWLERFDRLSLRERAGIVAAVAALMYFVLHFVVTGPEEARRKSLEGRIDAQNSELVTVRKDIAEFTSLLAHDPNAQQQAQIDGMKATIGQANAVVAQLDTATPQVSAVLKELLAASPGLTLVSLKTLPASVAFQPKAAPVAPPKPAPGAAPNPPAVRGPMVTIYRHGIEISVKGGYLDLLPYLEKLQRYPRRLYWGDATLNVQEHPDSLLKLTVYMLSGQSGSPLR